MSEQHKTAVLQLFAAALLWSTAGVIIQGIPWNPLAISSARSFIGAAVLLCFFGVPRRRPAAIQLWGALFCATSSTCFAVALKYTTAANAVVLSFTAPMYVVLFSRSFLGEKVQRRDWILVGILFCGIVLFFADELTVEGLIGNLVALLNGVLFACFILALRKHGNHSTGETVFYGFLFAALASLPWLPGQPLTVWNMFLVALLGIFQLGLAYVFYARAVPHVSAVEAAVIPMLEPIAGPLWVALVHHQYPGPFATIGGALVLSGVLWRGLFSDVRKEVPIHQ